MSVFGYGMELKAKHIVGTQVVHREVNAPSKLKYSFSNADKEIPVSRLTFMQNQRFWVEHALKNGKQEVGLGDYQVRG